MKNLITKLTKFKSQIFKGKNHGKSAENSEGSNSRSGIFAPLYPYWNLLRSVNKYVPFSFTKSSPKLPDAICTYDRSLFFIYMVFLMLGLVAVFSASVIDIDYYHLSASKRALTQPDMFRYLKKDSINILMGLFCFCVVLCIPMRSWQNDINKYLFTSTLIMLIMLAFGLGKTINGATRWIPLGIMNFQPAELSKLAIICFLASYITRRYEEVRNKELSLAKPAFLAFLFSVLLSRQPDTGTAVVLFIITIGMFFLAGVKLKQLFIVGSLGALLLTATILLNEYKLKRIKSFWQPLDDPYGAGYQLTNSLMAFGRGEFFGEGLGNSVLKWAYLPESHTDFVMAVLGEELGMIGVFFVVCMLGFLFYRAVKITRESLLLEKRFAGFFASGISILIFCQGYINLGASLGILPTKGLTFPLVSYGGSSLIIISITIGILLRIDYENRQQMRAR